MKKKLSIRDIAKQLDISITTVSFIMNGKAKEKRISDELTNKVLKLVEEVNYKPNQIAQSLRTGKSKIIGLMVEDISNPFFASVARLIEGNAYERGYKILYCSTEGKADKARELISMFKDWQIDGSIITPTEGIEEEIQSLINEDRPVVLFDRYMPAIDASYVVIDNYDSTYKGVTHLIEQGYKNIGFVTLDSSMSQMIDRRMGYEGALAEHGLTPCIKKISFDKSNEKIIMQIASFLKKNKELDAVFFSTNYFAIRGLEAINRLGLTIPTDLGVVAFDDHDTFQLYNPSITAIAQPIEEISKQVIQIMLDGLDGTSTDTAKKQFVLPTNLIVRKSSVPKK
ncbi:substrate-binding domain-containing protein [Pontibacter sp. XAAS-A31]|nr:substrate-binding domain-containing protein [Pontibacter harenae]